jgi:hypothetical protein
MDFLTGLLIKFGSENTNEGLSTHNVSIKRHLEPPAFGIVPYKKEE